MRTLSCQPHVFCARWHPEKPGYQLKACWYDSGVAYPEFALLNNNHAAFDKALNKAIAYNKVILAHQATNEIIKRCRPTEFPELKPSHFPSHLRP